MTEQGAQEKWLKSLDFVQNQLDGMAAEIKRISAVVEKLRQFSVTGAVEMDEIPVATKSRDLPEENVMHVVEGKFDGYFMVGEDQKKYPVPLNYSSKSKLVPGDGLKLSILEDGKLVYKLIRAVERKHLRAVLSVQDDGKFSAVTPEGQVFFLNQAAVTFFRGVAGDELFIIVNKDGTGQFAALEAVIKK